MMAIRSGCLFYFENACSLSCSVVLRCQKPRSLLKSSEKAKYLLRTNPLEVVMQEHDSSGAASTGLAIIS